MNQEGMDYGDYMSNFLLIYIYFRNLIVSDMFADKFPDEINEKNNNHEKINRVYNWVTSLENKNLNSPMRLYSKFTVGLRYVDILDIYNW